MPLAWCAQTPYRPTSWIREDGLQLHFWARGLEERLSVSRVGRAAPDVTDADVTDALQLLGIPEARQLYRSRDSATLECWPEPLLAAAEWLLPFALRIPPPSPDPRDPVPVEPPAIVVRWHVHQGPPRIVGRCEYCDLRREMRLSPTSSVCVGYRALEERVRSTNAAFLQALRTAWPRCPHLLLGGGDVSFVSMEAFERWAQSPVEFTSG